jgi:hypothetical protein
LAKVSNDLDGFDGMETLLLPRPSEITKYGSSVPSLPVCAP